MRRRSTYITPPSGAVNPADVQVKTNQLLLGALKAAREERLTLGLDELPAEIVEVLTQSHELHVRWAPEHAYNTTAPFLSRISAGLHVQYTPLSDGQPDLLCPLLHKLFGLQLRCRSPRATFVRPALVSERFAQTASWQYHSLAPSMQAVVAYLQRTVCRPADLVCLHTAALLNMADAVDFDYDSIAHTLTLTARWSKQPAVSYDPVGDFTTLDAWNLDIQARPGDVVEVGLLSESRATEPADLQLSGFLTVLGDDDHPKATLFSFPSRHHTLPPDQARAQRYTVAFDQPTGLHPLLRISFTAAADLVEPQGKPPGSACALQTYLTLPSYLFADKYAFASNDALFQQSHHLGPLRALTGETDLEAPDYLVQPWGSALLLELQTPNQTASPPVDAASPPAGWDVTIPLHFRYLEPRDGGLSSVEVPWPVVFWACTADEGTRFPVNPFDRIHLGYDGLFGPRTMFYHLDAAPHRRSGARSGARLVERVDVPVLDTRAARPRTIELVTVLAIAAGFFWIVWKLTPLIKTLRPASGRGSGERSPPTKKAQ